MVGTNQAFAPRGLPPLSSRTDFHDDDVVDDATSFSAPDVVEINYKKKNCNVQMLMIFLTTKNRNRENKKKQKP